MIESLRRAKTRTSAVFFYLGYGLFVLLFSVLIGGVALVVFATSVQTSLILINSVSSLMCMGLGMLILHSKGDLDHVGYWCVVLTGGILAFFTNGVLGMVPIAYLTTRAPAPEKQWEINVSELS